MKSFGQKPWMLPQPVLIIGTYNNDGTPNAMNAAWGGHCTGWRDSRQVLFPHPSGPRLLHLYPYPWPHEGRHGVGTPLSRGMEADRTADRRPAAGGAQQGLRRDLPQGRLPPLWHGLSRLRVPLHLPGIA